MNSKIINEITRQRELMNINEQSSIKDMIAQGIFNSLMKDTLGMDLPGLDSGDENELTTDKNLPFTDNLPPNVKT